MTTLDKMLQGLANALGASLSTLTTTAKTVVGAINELKSGLTSTDTTVSGHTSTIGSGALDTTSQTLIGAINEVLGNSKPITVTYIEEVFDMGASENRVIYSDSDKAAYLIIARENFAYVVGANNNKISAGQMYLVTDRREGYNVLTNSTRRQYTDYHSGIWQPSSGVSWATWEGTMFAEWFLAFPRVSSPNTFEVKLMNTSGYARTDLHFDCLVIKIPMI